MILFHGSYVEVSTPDLLHTRHNVDFGVGFYTTPIKEQAEKWCQKFIRRKRLGVLSRYTLNESCLEQVKVLRFDRYSEEWLDFILQCRSGKDQSDYDIVIGGVANDKVFNTVELYFDHLIEKGEALQRLKFEAPNLQIAFRSQAVIDQYLHFEGSERL